MKLYSIETGRFKLDGGAMFGVVPKVIWQKTNPADEQNQIDMAMRCLLIEDDNRLFLVDNGIGHKYNEKFARLYSIDHNITLDGELAKLGLHRSDITDLIITHLHFDHCGGTTEYNSAKNRFEIAFPKAKLWLQKSQLALAEHPNPREKASFFPENFQPIAESDQLCLIDGEHSLTPNIRLEVVDGHTSGMQLPVIQYKGHTILYGADLFPTYGHLPLPYVMGYDTRPLITLEEREKYLPKLVDENWIVFYEHDPYNECGRVKRNERGGYVSAEVFELKDL